MLCVTLQDVPWSVSSRSSRQCLLSGTTEEYTAHCWFSCTAVGHNTLKNSVAIMCKEAGIQGYKTILLSNCSHQTVCIRCGWTAGDGKNWPLQHWRNKELQKDIHWTAAGYFWHSQQPENVQHQLFTAIVSQQPTQLISSSTNNICIPNITDSSSSNHSGAFPIFML